MSEHRFATPEPVRLEINVAAGDVRIETVDGEESTVALEGPHELVDAVKVELVGDRLIVAEPRRSFVGRFGIHHESLHVLAHVPHGSRAAVRTASSDATLDGSFGGLDVNSASGGVEVTGEVDGDAHVKSASGDVRLARVTGELTAHTASGAIAAQSLGGSATMRSVSGDVHIGSLREGTVNVQSVSGDVELGIASGTRIDLDAASLSGEVGSDVPLSRTADGDGDGGPTVVIRGNTVSGDFRVFRASAGDSPVVLG